MKYFKWRELAMTRETIAKLEALGVDIDTTLERFVENEALYFKCLRTFVSNHDYDDLIAAIDNNDANACFDSAHALKGVTANLGFNNLYEEIKIITEVFRIGSMNYDPENLNAIKEEYQLVIDTIRSFDE